MTSEDAIEYAIQTETHWLLVAWQPRFEDGVILDSAPGFVDYLDGTSLDDNGIRWKPVSPERIGVYRLKTFILADGEDDFSVKVICADLLWESSE